MRLAAALIALATVAAVPASALAKGRGTVRACGTDACVVLAGETLAGRIASPQEDVDPPPPEPYYRLEISPAGTGAYSVLYAPHAQLVGTNAGGLLWYVPRTDALRDLEPALGELEPYPAPRAWPRFIPSPASWPPPAETTAAETTDGRSWTLALTVLLAGLLALAALRRRHRPARA